MTQTESKYTNDPKKMFKIQDKPRLQFLKENLIIPNYEIFHMTHIFLKKTIEDLNGNEFSHTKKGKDF